MKSATAHKINSMVAAISLALGTQAYANTANDTQNTLPYQALENLPDNRLKHSLAKLPPHVQQKVLAQLTALGVPALDTAFMEADNNGELFYVEMGLVQGAGTGEAPSAAATLPAIDVFNLHSKLGAANTVYLDFDGGLVSGRAWGGGTSYDTLPYDLDGDPSTFNDSERSRIHQIWARMADDFSAFDIDVTTQAPASFGANVGWVLFTKDSDTTNKALPSQGAGGVAYLSVWGRSNYTYYQPAFVYYNRLGGGGQTYMAEAGSHELGHNLGLSHDGTSTTSYYGGLGENAELGSWAPIMGNSYSKNITQWSKGEYPDANQLQDDIAIITNKLGASSDNEGNAQSPTALIVDEFGQFSATNRELDPSNGVGDNKGTVQVGDSDWFQFNAGTGSAQISATPAWDAFTRSTRRGANLDIGLRLYDAGGSLIADSAGDAETSATLQLDLAAGLYTLEVYGTSGPYVSDYASQGHYYLNGSLPAAAPDTTPPDPNPMSFAQVPSAISHSEISMQATTATDDSGAQVSYLFSCQQGGTDCTSGTWQTGTEFMATGLQGETQYCFSVTAKDLANNQTLASALECATTAAQPMPPAAPSSFSASDGQDGTALLSWTDNSDDENAFEIQREKQHKNGSWRGTTVIAQLAQNTSNYVDSSDAGIFRYRVRATNNAGPSSWSNWSQVTVSSGGGDGGGGDKPCRGKKCAP
ncbi:M12 family metallo-peptidase [Pseudoalteromonas sp. T1lg75]|uniref:M12 family metallo-peptidase n=1 Tax=Pseudoalteromonas sp. T1lg75 TaxID=2077102 RepID=UPI001319BB0C|nr:M12 family metallo-peptidase [Pseudoalteromonas sp. T1lg75]